MKSENRRCQNCKQSFTIDPEDFGFYEKMRVPPPTWCPECRMIRRMIFRNDHNLFRRREAVNYKEIFSGIPPETPVQTYTLEYWNSDAWDQMSYGRDYDFSRPFFEQFKELWYSIPWPGKNGLDLVNCDYSDQIGHCKNAYLCFDCDYIEDSSYLITCSFSKNSFDMKACSYDELCYEGVLIDKSYQTFFSVDCEGCTDVWFSRGLIGCSNCFGCVNLRNKNYYIFNQPYTKEEYQTKLQEFNLGSSQSLSALSQKAREYWLGFPVKFMRGRRNVNSSGELLKDTKNVNYSYLVYKSENIKYSQSLNLGATDSYDYTVWGHASSKIYESLAVGEECSDVKFCFDCWPASQNLEYSIMCRSSQNLFGCAGLKKKQYCIFNKQYNKESFDKLRTRIVEQMNAMPYIDKRGRVYKYGEFFPPELSPFAYNQTTLLDFYPIKKEEAIAEGYRWAGVEPQAYQATIKAVDLPDHIKDVADDVLKALIGCIGCGRAYRIVETELQFLRRMGLPLPRLCVACRHRRRMEYLPAPHFWKRQCAKCGIEVTTVYSSERPEIIYCESCYQSEVV